MSEVELLPFEMTDMPLFPFAIVCGQRGTGKTLFLQNWLSENVHHAHTAMHYLVCGNPAVRDAWSGFIHPLFHYSLENGLNQLVQIVDRQKKVLRMHRNEQVPPNRQVVIVLDDVGSNRSIMHSRVMAYLATAGRHLCISVFITLQYLVQVPPEIRANIDLLCVMNTQNENMRKSIHREFVSSIPWRQFLAKLEGATRDYGALMVTQKCNVEREKLCTALRYGFPDHARLGGEQMLAYADRHFLDVSDSGLSHASSSAVLVDDVDREALQSIIGRVYRFSDKQGDIVVRERRMCKLKMA